jgi:hypothetical protein
VSHEGKYCTFGEKRKFHIAKNRNWSVSKVRNKGSNTGKRAKRKNLRHPRERFKTRMHMDKSNIYFSNGKQKVRENA